MTSWAISIHALLAESDPGKIRIFDDIFNFYPRSPCGERRARRASRQQPAGISIHALLAESDRYPACCVGLLSNFYPRSPCGERLFLGSLICPPRDFYPRSPCGERRVHYDNYNLHCVISIHALLAESDYKERPGQKARPKFLSTLSLRRAT